MGPTMSDLQRAVEAVERAASRRLPIVAFTGAGISQESGIPTFHGTSGIWQEHDPQKVATPEGFMEDPERGWRFHERLRRECLAATPNLAHIALTWLEKAMRGRCPTPVITQNIDGLHQRAGSSNVLELHGSAHRVRCTRCDYHSRALPEQFTELPPVCDCGAVLRPDVVWFGEQLPRETMDRAGEWAEMAEVMLVIGTSATVQPAASIPIIALRSGATLIEINPHPTELSKVADVILRGPAGEQTPALVDAVASRLSA